MIETSSVLAQKSSKKVSPEVNYQWIQMLPMDQVTRQRMSTRFRNMDRNITDNIDKQFQEWIEQNFNEGSEGSGVMNGS